LENKRLGDRELHPEEYEGLSPFEDHYEEE